jgi:hypothetical protein
MFCNPQVQAMHDEAFRDGYAAGVCGADPRTTDGPWTGIDSSYSDGWDAGRADFDEEQR